MADELISRQAAMLEIERRYRDYRQRSEKPIGCGCVEINRDLQMAAAAVKGVLDFMHDIPAVDAVEVVRCEDCKHCDFCGDSYAVCWKRSKYHNFIVHKGEFCNFGKRREENAAD